MLSRQRVLALVTLSYAVLSRQRVLALVTLTLLNAFTVAAGATAAVLLRSNLDQLAGPRVAIRPVVRAITVLLPEPATGPLPTGAGLSTALLPLLSSPQLGPDVGAVVTDPATGRVLFTRGAASPFIPASANKLATAAAALTLLGPRARFTTRVVRGGTAGSIVLVGGGDPTLAVSRPPAPDFPQPATLAALAASAARALRAAHVTTVRLSYDTSLFTGPGGAPGWSPSYVSTGDVTPVSALEVDQGRLTAGGAPEDADDPYNYRARSPDPAAAAARAFASLLAGRGIRVRGTPGPGRAPPGAAEIAQVRSPTLADVVEWMLIESNNDIAEALARQVAKATGRQASFSGGAAAVRAVLGRLGAAAGVHTVDGSGLSPLDRISPAALARLITLAASPRYPRLRAIVTGLPVAGFSGTLSPEEDRFVTKQSAPGAGLVRAKTGTLDNVRALAGLVVDAQGRLLCFVFVINRVPASSMTPSAAVLDHLAATLARCGCR